jgi:hypothetical protein
MRVRGLVSVYSLIEHISTISAVPFAICGFGITFWQLARTKRAALAAQAAAESAAHTVGKNNLVSLIYKLEPIEGQLENAVKSNCKQWVISILRDWRLQAAEARELIELLKPVAPAKKKSVLRSIQRSVSAVVSAKDRLAESSSVDLEGTTLLAMKALAAANEELRRLAVNVDAEISKGPSK